MIKYEDLRDDVKSLLSERRFKHLEGVVSRALEYAKIYDVDENIVMLTAIAHDIAKELTEDENEQYINQYNIKLNDVEKINSNLLHAKIGAYICKYKYNFTDDMVNSIMYHTTGRPNMSILEKIIYLADATDPNRNYDDIEYYVNIIKEDLDKGMLEVSKWVIKHLLKKNVLINVDSIDCYNYYLQKCNMAEKK